MGQKIISVFIASPSDLSNERQYFKDAIRQLNVGFGDGAGVEFIPLGWEDTLAVTGRRSQGIINQEIDKCDVFILTLYRRWGQEAPDAKPYSSYTEEEFHRALERWRIEGKPEIFVFFKRVDAESEADPGPQLKKVMEFRRQLEETRSVLYRYFDEKKSFINEIDRHLRAFAKGELPPAAEQCDIVVLNLAALEEIDKLKKITKQKELEAEKARDAEQQAVFKLESRDLQLAEDAAMLSKEGNIEFARQKFAMLAVESMNLRVLSFAHEFFIRIGDLDSALMVIQKWLNLSGQDSNTIDTAAGYGNLGNLYLTRGEIECAEEMYQKSLAINQALGHKEGMANQYGNLGNLYKIRGELEFAEDMHQKSLLINEMLDCKEGMAVNYCNLGNICHTRGELERAEEMYQKSLAINERLGRKEGVANQYGNLGNVYKTRGELELAEKMYKKSLSVNEMLGFKEGMASNYGNLGNLYQTLGELEHAEEMYRKSLAIEVALGRKEGMASDYGNLGNLYQTRGELERAEEMYQKSMAINEVLGFKEGMASNYGNLGNLYQARGEFERAEVMYQKSLIIFDGLSSSRAETISKWLIELRNKNSAIPPALSP